MAKQNNGTALIAGDVLRLAWPSIEPFLDVPTLVALSKVSKNWSAKKEPRHQGNIFQVIRDVDRDLVVDHTTGKIKKTVMKVHDDLEHNNEGYLDMASVSNRVGDYVPHLLQSLQFPSLVCLDIGFPPNVTTWDNVRVVSFPVAFTMFAMNADRLTNLEELTITVDALIQHERHGSLRASYDILGQNLSRCMRRTRKLKKLVIKNWSPTSKYSTSLLAAMVPVVQAGLLSLEEVGIRCGEEPSSSDYPRAGYDFFKAVLSLQKLRTLDILVDGQVHGQSQLLNDFLNGSRYVHVAFGRLPSHELETVAVKFPGCQGVETPFPVSSISPFLHMVANRSHCLARCEIYAPNECWDSNSITALGNLMSRNESLDRLFVWFYGYTDRSGRLLESAHEFIHRRPSCDVEFFVMGYADDASKMYHILAEARSPCDGQPVIREGPDGYHFVKKGGTE